MVIQTSYIIVTLALNVILFLPSTSAYGEKYYGFCIDRWGYGDSAVCKSKNETSLPGNLPKNIRTLELQMENLREIPNFFFQGLTNLKYLTIKNSKIEILRIDAFKIANALIYITIVNNENLKTIEAGVFKGLPNIKEIELERLPSLEKLEDHTFYGLKKLKQLNIIDTGITEITNKTFEGMHSLGRLDLKRNKKLTKIADNSFKDFKKVWWFELNGSPLLTELRRNTLNGLKKAYYFTLTGMSLKEQ